MNHKGTHQPMYAPLAPVGRRSTVVMGVLIQFHIIQIYSGITSGRVLNISNIQMDKQQEDRHR